MSAATVPSVYASALVELATENGRLAEVVADAAAVAEVFAGHPELLTALNSPDLSREQGKALLGSIFGDKVTKEVMDFLRLAVDRDRIDDVADILAEVERLAVEIEGRHEIQVTTAVELDASNRARVESLLRKQRGENITILYTVDTSIIGGLRIQDPERVVDFTASRHLAEMKRTMLEAPVAAAWTEA